MYSFKTLRTSVDRYGKVHPGDQYNITALLQGCSSQIRFFKLYHIQRSPHLQDYASLIKLLCERKQCRIASKLLTE